MRVMVARIIKFTKSMFLVTSKDLRFLLKSNFLSKKDMPNQIVMNTIKPYK
jgi:hypothetical protein